MIASIPEQTQTILRWGIMRNLPRGCRGPDLLDLLDPQVDTGVEEGQGHQREDPGRHEYGPVQEVGHVGGVVPEGIRWKTV